MEGWIADTLTLVLFSVLVYPVLSLAEHWTGYHDLFVEKESGEVKRSFLLLFLSQTALVAFTCGLSCFIIIVFGLYAHIVCSALIALLVAFTFALSEMMSKGGVDTVTVPVADVLVLWAASAL